MAKNFILQLASLATLLASIPALIVLLFGIINLTFPDAADSIYSIDSAHGSIRFSIATLVIFFPAYIALTRLVNRARRNEGAIYHTLTRWVIYIALLIAGMIMLGDLVAVVYSFLEGDITIRFALKAGVMFLVIGSAFWYYALDAKGYWNDNEKKSVKIGALLTAIVVAVVIYGFTMIETPAEVREQKIDSEQISDLVNIQYRIESYYAREARLPNSLESAFADIAVPLAPEGRPAYGYNVTGDTSYQLCATFSKATTEQEFYETRSIASPKMDMNNYNWDHGAGEKCFERTIISE